MELPKTNCEFHRWSCWLRSWQARTNAQHHEKVRSLSWAQRQNKKELWNNQIDMNTPNGQESQCTLFRRKGWRQLLKTLPGKKKNRHWKKPPWTWKTRQTKRWWKTNMITALVAEQTVRPTHHGPSTARPKWHSLRSSATTEARATRAICRLRLFWNRKRQTVCSHVQHGWTCSCCRMDWSSSSFLGSFWAFCHCLLRMYVRLEPRKSSAGSKWAIGCQLESLQPRESSFHPLRISRFQSSYSTLHYRTGHSAPTKAPRSSLLERSKAFAAGPSTAVSARATVLPQCPAPGWPVSTQWQRRETWDAVIKFTPTCPSLGQTHEVPLGEPSSCDGRPSSSWWSSGPVKKQLADTVRTPAHHRDVERKNATRRKTKEQLDGNSWHAHAWLCVSVCAFRWQRRLMANLMMKMHNRSEATTSQTALRTHVSERMLCTAQFRRYGAFAEEWCSVACVSLSHTHIKPWKLGHHNTEYWRSPCVPHKLSLQKDINWTEHAETSNRDASGHGTAPPTLHSTTRYIIRAPSAYTPKKPPPQRRLLTSAFSPNHHAPKKPDRSTRTLWPHGNPTHMADLAWQPAPHVANQTKGLTWKWTTHLLVHNFSGWEEKKKRRPRPRPGPWKMRECKNGKTSGEKWKTGNKTWTKGNKDKGNTKGQTWRNGVEVETWEVKRKGGERRKVLKNFCVLKKKRRKRRQAAAHMQKKKTVGILGLTTWKTCRCWGPPQTAATELPRFVFDTSSVLASFFEKCTCFQRQKFAPRALRPAATNFCRFYFRFCF